MAKIRFKNKIASIRQIIKSGASSIGSDAEKMEQILLSNEGLLTRIQQKKPKKKNKFLEKFRIGI